MGYGAWSEGAVDVMFSYVVFFFVLLFILIGLFLFLL